MFNKYNKTITVSTGADGIITDEVIDGTGGGGSSLMPTPFIDTESEVYISIEKTHTEITEDMWAINMSSMVASKYYLKETTASTTYVEINLNPTGSVGVFQPMFLKKGQILYDKVGETSGTFNGFIYGYKVRKMTVGAGDTPAPTPITDYATLTNKPKINGIELLGDKTCDDLSILSFPRVIKQLYSQLLTYNKYSSTPIAINSATGVTLDNTLPGKYVFKAGSVSANVFTSIYVNGILTKTLTALQNTTGYAEITTTGGDALTTSGSAGTWEYYPPSLSNFLGSYSPYATMIIKDFYEASNPTPNAVCRGLGYLVGFQLYSKNIRIHMTGEAGTPIFGLNYSTSLIQLMPCNNGEKFGAITSGSGPMSIVGLFYIYFDRPLDAIGVTIKAR